MLDTIRGWIVEFTDWLLETLLWLPRELFKLIMDALASVIEAIPVPDFVSEAAGAFGSIPGNVLFFAHYFAVSEGIAFVLSAYLIRFLIRRIPLIG